MLKPAVSLGADMTAEAVIERLAMNGFWIDIERQVVWQRLEALSKRVGRSLADVAQALARDPGGCGAAIRRQSGTQVLWYAWELRDVLDRCAAAAPSRTLEDVLGLQSLAAHGTIALESGEYARMRTAVVMDGERPVKVSLCPNDGWRIERVFGSATGKPPGADFTLRGESAVAPPERAAVWPRVEAPETVTANQRFEVEVGFGASQQAGVAGSAVRLPESPDTEPIDMTVELSAGQGVRALDGWRRPLRTSLHDILSAKVTFELAGIEPPGPNRPFLTMLEVRYVLNGTVCGVAARPLVIEASAGASPPQLAAGEPWSQPCEGGPVTLAEDKDVPDLTIEITKPDRNASSGQYACQLYSPHALAASRGPFQMDIGHDAKTFSRAIVEEVRAFANSELLDTNLGAIGQLVAQCLPPAVFEALREVADKTRPQPPAVLIVSVEPYVPWELAWLEHPIDAARPRYLGAQALVGRWLRDGRPPDPAGPEPALQRPATNPPSRMTVRHLAAMAAWYRADSGLRRLPKAEEEAQKIVELHDGFGLDGSARSMRHLLDATLDPIGAAQAIHFAGHGDFDPTRPDSAALFLMDGTPLRSTQFRAAQYGGALQPLLFLNACMLGIGGELLGDMGGFPGNSLRGGFGAVLGALWEIDDTVAHDVALEFWQRALPPAPARGEPIGAILRDLRAKYVPDAEPAPVSTYLSYVFYGHPRLTLDRAAPEPAAIRPSVAA